MPPGGYAWWYADALSDDGEYGLTVIAFIGSVFSPYYAWARRGGDAPPLDHCAFNVALYGRRARRWTMTERGAGQVRRDASVLSIGTSEMRWSGGVLEIDIDERCSPVPRPVRGIIRLIPASMFDRSYALDEASLHHWTPFAPCARIEVALSAPALRWSGNGYLDSNRGAVPLEDTFERWNWSRSGSSDHSVVFYDVTPRSGVAQSLALRFTQDGRQEAIDAPPTVDLSATGWGVSRRTRADGGEPVRVVKTLEDAPFYSRSVLDSRVHGVRAPAIHESVDLNRFRSRWVQCLLPFRMPRIAR